MNSLESFRTGEKVSGQCGMFLDTLVFFGQFSDSLDQFTHFDICRENNLRTFGTNVANKFTHFVRKVFARKILPTGKLGLFRPLQY